MTDRTTLVGYEGQVVYVCCSSASAAEIHEADYRLTEQFKRALAALHIIASQHYYLSPTMFFDYLKYMGGRAGDWETWKHSCEVAMNRSDFAYVLTFPNWTHSNGVAGEVNHFLSHGRQVLYEPDIFDLIKHAT